MKALARALTFVAVLPVWALYWCLAALGGERRAFSGFVQAFSLLPGTIGGYLRAAFCRLAAQRVEATASIGFGTLFSHPELVVGRHVYIGPYCIIGAVEIGDNALIASHVSITNGYRQHGIERLDVPIREQPGEWPRVTIGEDTWIGERAVVMCDVGKHCVIGAGAVVTRPIPDYAIAVGNPARIVRFRNEEAGGPTEGPPLESRAQASGARRKVAAAS